MSTASSTSMDIDPPPIQRPVRLVVVSDTHGMHELLTEYLTAELGADVLIHCGDVCDRGNLQHIRDFCGWLDRIPIPEKLVIQGNHDQDLRHPERIQLKHEFGKCQSNVRYLFDETVLCANGRLRVHGASWESCKSGQFDRVTADGVPDVLLAHIPPCIKYSIAKAKFPNPRGWRYSKPLTRVVLDNCIPICLSGHVHWSRGVLRTTFEQYDFMFVNVCSTKQHGKGVTAPVVLDYIPESCRVVSVQCPPH